MELPNGGDSTNRIRELRKDAGLTQQELASAVGIRQCAISAYERGTRTPNLQTAKKISTTLGITVDELIAEENDEAADD